MQSSPVDQVLERMAGVLKNAEVETKVVDSGVINADDEMVGGN